MGATNGMGATKTVLIITFLPQTAFTSIHQESTSWKELAMVLYDSLAFFFFFIFFFLFGRALIEKFDVLESILTFATLVTDILLNYGSLEICGTG